MERNLESLVRRAEILEILAPLTVTGSNKARAAAEHLITELMSLDNSEPQDASRKPDDGPVVVVKYSVARPDDGPVVAARTSGPAPHVVPITLAALDTLVLDAERLKMIEKHGIRVFHADPSVPASPWYAIHDRERAARKEFATFTEALDDAIARAKAAAVQPREGS